MKPTQSRPPERRWSLSSPALPACLALALAASSPFASAQDTMVMEPIVAEDMSVPTSTADSDAVDLAPVMVIGDQANIPNLAGSAAFVTSEQIDRQTYINPNRVLQQAPGVYVREEDGFGNFPNISLRGADGGRSSKATIMEDGIMMAPAPYSAPSAYYTPRIGRMSGVEILKGSSQIQYGPHTTGGVVNYLSTPFVELPTFVPAPVEPSGKNPKAPVEPVAQPNLIANEFYLKSTYGSDNTFLNHAWYGHTQQFDAGTLGLMIELFHNQSDGFRYIDRVGGDTGFTTVEPMVRLFWEPDSLLKQRFELRVGYTYFDADETYLGLNDQDLAASPLRRYVSTQYDNIRSDQFRTSLTHTIQFSESLRLQTDVYYTSFARDWYKLHDIRLSNGQRQSLAEALAFPGEGLNILKGNGAGSWRIRSNDREYYTLGVQSRADWQFETGSLQHDLTVGARLHYDETSRFQRDDIATVDSNGRVTNLRRGRQGAAGNREENVLAYTMFIEDSIRLGRLTVKPGLRWEHLEMEYVDRATSGDLSRVTGSGTGSLDVLAPGIGLVYDVTDTWSLFGGYYRGISTPSPRDYLRSDRDVETSDGFEAGVRHYGSTVQAELVGFFNSFEDLIVRDNIGGAGTTGDANGGSAEVAGIEFAVGWDPLADSGSDWRMPLRASATYTHAEVTSNSPSGDAESIFSGAMPGNRLPYVPEFAASAGIGVEYRQFGIYLDATYVDEMYGTASNTSSLRDPSGTPDARYGKTEEAFILDLSVNYQLNENVRLIAGISNITGESYISSRLPYGARSNAPRSYFGGVEIRF